MREKPRPSLRTRSPVAGLEWRRLGPVEVFAQSVSGTAPSAAMAATPAIVAAAAGSSTAWSFAVASVVALLIATCISEFTRRMAATGGLYTLTAKGLRPAGAYACALATLVGYGLLIPAALAGVAVYSGALLAQLTGHGLGRLGGAAVALVVGAAVTLLVLRGVRLSARVVLLVESVAIVLMLIVFGLLFAGGPLGVGTVSASGAAASGVSGVSASGAGASGAGGVLSGVLPALAAFIGFEIATSLGTEVRRPFRSVPRAVGLTVAVTGVLSVFAAQVQVLGFSATPGGLAAQPEPVVALATARGWSWMPAVLDVALTMSFLACALASATALARVVFSLARDGVLPRSLGRTHPRFRTPHVAVLVTAPIAAALAVLPLAAGMSAGTALVALLTLATCGFLTAYLLVCAAAPLFLRRIGELTWPAVLVSALAGPILLAVVVAFVATNPATGYPLAAFAVAGAGGYLWLRRKRPDELTAIGVYDETTTADVLLPGSSAA